jgi:branched-chain amino acid transport system permease protein
MDSLIQYLISSFSLGGLYALMTLGLVVVYGILRLINFAYGELVMVAGYGLLLFGNTQLAWPLVAILSIISAIVAAVVRQRRCSSPRLR